MLDLGGLTADPVAQSAHAASFVNRSDFLPPRLEDLAVLAVDGGGQQIISKGQQRQAAEGKNDGIPEAEADAEVPVQGSQAP